MKTFALVFALCILTVGVVGIIAPSELVWIARRFDTSAPFYVLAAIRIAFGVVLISVAPTSRAPKGLRVLGFFIVILGIAAAIAGLLAIGNARASIEWWMQQGSGVRRLTAIPVIALGGFIAYACAPKKWSHFVFALLLACGASALPTAPVLAQDSAELTDLAHKYLADERIRQSERATSADVERALAWLSDSVVYEHPRAGARIQGKDLLRQGMTHYLGATRAARDSIAHLSTAAGVVVIELKQTFETKEDNQWVPHIRRGIKVLEFEGRRIRRIIDYW